MLGSRGRAERSGSSKHRSAGLGPLKVAGGWLRGCRLAPTPGPLRVLQGDTNRMARKEDVSSPSLALWSPSELLLTETNAQSASKGEMSWESPGGPVVRTWHTPCGGWEEEAQVRSLVYRQWMWWARLASLRPSQGSRHTQLQCCWLTGSGQNWPLRSFFPSPLF